MINIVISECEGLIYSIASKYKNNYNIEDLYQVGCIGVMKAYKNFKKNLNVKFSTYAYNYILGEIIDYIRKDRNIRISNEYYDIYKRYDKVVNILRNKYCREPLFSEISEFMQIDEKELLCVLESASYTKNIEYEFGNSNMCDNENLINKLLLDEEIDKLQEPQKSIIKYRYFFGMTQQETAKTLDLSQAKVSREESITLKKIKNKIIV